MTADIEENLPGKGDIVAGKYRVDHVLGRGGMGLVVGATHTLLDQKVAIKFLTAEAEGELLARFGREARAVAKLKSEYVARVFDVGELDDGTPYMVMEYLAGKDLGDVCKERGKLSVDDAVLYILQACHAVAEAHGVGIIHRDLKPSNLFLTTTPDGEDCVKVLDFGISKDINAEPFSEGDGELTKTSMVLGTPYYMSPEQMRSARSVDARSDVWSIGAILYQLLTNDKPFRAASFPELVVKVLQDEPPPPTRRNGNIPAGLEAVVLRCLEKTPAKRYANIAEFAIDLAPFGPPAADVLAERIARVVERATHVSLPAVSKRHIPRGVTLPPGLSSAPVEVEAEAETVADTAAPSAPHSASVSSRPPTNAALAPTMPSPGAEAAPGSGGFIRERRPGQEPGTLTNASSVISAEEALQQQPAGLKRPLMLLAAAAVLAAAIGVGLGVMNRGATPAADGAEVPSDGEVSATPASAPTPSDTAAVEPPATASSDSTAAAAADDNKPARNDRRSPDPASPEPTTPEPTTPEPPPPTVQPEPSAKKPPPPPPPVVSPVPPPPPPVRPPPPPPVRPPPPVPKPDPFNNMTLKD